MSILGDLVQKDLINMDNRSSDKESFFSSAADTLVEYDFVEESFFQAINERERKYPTGLELPNIVIAIPHTDVEHIKKPFVYFNKMTQKSLTFVQMGTDDVEINPSYVIILGIKKPQEQVGLLSTMIELFSDEEFINDLNSLNNAEEVYELLKSK